MGARGALCIRGTRCTPRHGNNDQALCCGPDTEAELSKWKKPIERHFQRRGCVKESSAQKRESNEHLEGFKRSKTGVERASGGVFVRLKTGVEGASAWVALGFPLGVFFFKLPGFLWCSFGRFFPEKRIPQLEATPAGTSRRPQALLDSDPAAPRQNVPSFRQLCARGAAGKPKRGPEKREFVLPPVELHGPLFPHQQKEMETAMYKLRSVRSVYASGSLQNQRAKGGRCCGKRGKS